MSKLKCPKCGCEKLLLRKNEKKPTATDLFCSKCGAWVKFANKDDRRLYEWRK